MAVMDMLEEGEVKGEKVDGASTETSSTPLGGRCVPTGPTPEKGSGQYRFRQLLMDKSNNRTATPSRSFPSMVTNQISQITGQGVKPDASGLPLNPMTNSLPGQTHLPPLSLPTYHPMQTMGFQPMMQTPDALGTLGVQSVQGIQDARDTQGRAPVAKKAEGTTQGDGKDGLKANGDSNSQTAPVSYSAILSKECQKRSFNPHFIEWVNPDGRYMCSVELNNGGMVHDTRSFGSANEAKQALAKRAIGHVKKIPCPDPAVRAAEKAEKAEKARLASAAAASAWGNATNGAYQSIRHDEGVKGKPCDNVYPRHPVPPVVEPGLRSSQYGSVYVSEPQQSLYVTGSYGHQTSEVSYLIDRIYTLCEGHGPSPFVLGDAWAARAFLEGFALGERLHRISGPPVSAIQGPRSRSPPLRTTIDRAYPRRSDRPGREQTRSRERERSPIASNRRHHRERTPIRRSRHRSSNGLSEA